MSRYEWKEKCKKSLHYETEGVYNYSFRIKIKDVSISCDFDASRYILVYRLTHINLYVLHIRNVLKQLVIKNRVTICELSFE